MKGHKRHIVLLEVLIALFLVVIALFPLLYPHVRIVKEESKIVDELELYPKFSLIHGANLIDLYERRYTLEALDKGVTLDITPEQLALPYEGTLLMKFAHKKEGSPTSGYLLNLHYTLHRLGTNKPLLFDFSLFLKGPAKKRE